MEPTVTLRRLRATDAIAVQTAFASNADMAWQGDVSTLGDAEVYVSKISDPASSHEAWAVSEGDRLVGSVDVPRGDPNE